MTYDLLWENLFVNKCPMCGKDWKLDTDGFYKCMHHKKRFKIGGAKAEKIKQSIDERRAARWPILE
ncbi:hypothetical protein ACVWZV_002198 [Bradyrhizobium sp. GM5.1]